MVKSRSGKRAASAMAAPAPPPAAGRWWLLPVVLFMAGFSGLVYEVVWTRLLTLTFGVTVYAGAAVLCAFMGGLALGSWVSGRAADRFRAPTRLVAGSQLLLAGLAMALPYGVHWLTEAYAPIQRALPPGSPLTMAARFALALPVLLVPAALIAAAFPLITRAMVAARGGVGRGVALAYGVDTLGGVCGAVAAGFVLIRVVGVNDTILLAAAVNVGAALLALLAPVAPPAAEAPAPPSRAVPPSPNTGAARSRVLLAAFGLSGAAALAVEVLTMKVLVHLVGTGIYAFTVMLACFLFGLGAGSLLCLALMRRKAISAGWFALAEAGLGLSVLCLPLQFAVSPRLLDAVAGALPFWLSNAVVSFALLFIPTLLMGATLPLLVPLIAAGPERVGISVGTAYSVNTLGGVCGVLGATFVLLPHAGFATGLALCGLTYLVAALLAVLASGAMRRRRPQVVSLAVAGMAAVLAVGATRTSLIPIVVHTFMTSEHPSFADLLFYEEGAEGTVAVIREDAPRTGYCELLAVNGLQEGGTDIGSLRAWALLSSLPTMLHSHRAEQKKVLVCAFGLGITVGTVALQDSKSVMCVELVPQVVHGAPFFASHNFNPQQNPKVTIRFEDARNFLLTTNEKYDIVILDATHPTTGDSWMLFTREYYQLVRRVMAPDAVCAQWVPLHGMTSADYWSIVRTFQSVFPHTSLWHPALTSHSILVATPARTSIDLAYLHRRLQEPIMRQVFSGAQMTDEYAILTSLVTAEDKLAELTASYRLNTDDLCPVQFTPPYLRTVSDRTVEFYAITSDPTEFVADLRREGPRTEEVREEVARAYESSRLLRGGLLASEASGSSKEAREMWERAYRLRPTDPDLPILLGLRRPAVPPPPPVHRLLQ